jgi:hypothetical protein
MASLRSPLALQRELMKRLLKRYASFLYIIGNILVYNAQSSL